MLAASSEEEEQPCGRQAQLRDLERIDQIERDEQAAAEGIDNIPPHQQASPRVVITHPIALARASYSQSLPRR